MSQDAFFRTFVKPFKGLRSVFFAAGPPVKPVSYMGRQMFEVMHKGTGGGSPCSSWREPLHI